MANTKKYVNEQFNKKSKIDKFTKSVSKSENADFYFHKGHVNFYGSKMQDVYKNEDNTIYIARENLYGLKEPYYKILIYDNTKNKLLSSPMIKNKEERDELFRKMKKGNLSEQKYQAIFNYE